MIKQAVAAVLACAIVAAVSLCPARLEAHQIDLSNARIELKPDRTVHLEVALKGSDVDRVAAITNQQHSRGGSGEPAKLLLADRSSDASHAQSRTIS